MKTAMKKLLSLVLVAMLLVSAVPFQASAAAGDVDADGKVTAVIKFFLKSGTAVENQYGQDVVEVKELVGTSIDLNQFFDKKFPGATYEYKTNPVTSITLEAGTPAYEITVIPAESAPVESTPAESTPAESTPAESTPTTKYRVYFYDVNNQCHWNIDVVAGSTIDVADNSTQTQIGYAEEHVGTKEGYTFKGWQINGQGDVLSTATVAQMAINADTSVYPVFTKNASDSDNNSTAGSVTLNIKVNGSTKFLEDVPVQGSATVSSLIGEILGSDWTSNYGFNEVDVDGTTYYRADVTVNAGEKATVSLSRKYSKDNSNKVYLHVYLNGDASTIALTKDITGTYLMDDWSTNTDEILKYLKNNYYTAKDTSSAVTIDGLYWTNGDGTFPTKYYADNKVSRLDDIDEKLEDGYVHISVMLKNAITKTSSSSSTADSSNPKTGDSIYMVATVMGLSAAALAAVYYVSKKRAF